MFHSIVFHYLPTEYLGGRGGYVKTSSRIIYIKINNPDLSIKWFYFGHNWVDYRVWDYGILLSWLQKIHSFICLFVVITSFFKGFGVNFGEKKQLKSSFSKLTHKPGFISLYLPASQSSSRMNKWWKQHRTGQSVSIFFLHSDRKKSSNLIMAA